MDRQVRHRLAVLRHVEEVTGNVAMTCRYFRISRPTYHNWLRRYEAEGTDGLRDRSRRPRTSPNVTRAEVVEKTQCQEVLGRDGHCRAVQGQPSNHA